MADDLKEDIQIGANTTGVEAGVNRVKRSLADLGLAAGQAGKAAASGMGAAGEGGDRASKKVESATRSMQASLQRLIAEQQAGSKASREYWEALASQRNVNVTALKPLLDQMDALKDKARYASASADGLSTSLANVARAAAAAFIGNSFIQGAAEAAKAMYEASAAAERLRTTLEFATGGKTAQEMAYLRKVTQELGLQFGSTATAYASFQAAARGTALAGQGARDVFQSIAKASAVMGLSVDQTSGVLLALQQMISKGTVQAEELRGQLGERLPGAFQIAAKAMGVTTAELGKMLEAGQVVASDFLPKFGKALEESLGDSAEKASVRLDAAVNRFENAWSRLKQNAGDSGASNWIADQMSSGAAAMDAISVAMERARGTGAGFFGQMGAGLSVMYDLGNLTNRVMVNMYDNAKATKLAEETLQKLKNTQATGGDGAWIRIEIQRVENYIARLKDAKRERDQLAGGGPTDPRDQSGYKSRGQSYADEAERLKGVQAAMGKVLNGLAGVKDDFYKDLNALYAGYQNGLIKLSDYQAAVAKLIKESGTEKPDSGIKAEQSAYESLVASIKSKIAQNDEELRYSGRLTESDKLRLQMMAQLEAGSKKLTGEHKARALALLETLEVQEKDKEAIKRAQAVYQEQVAIQEELAAAYVAESRAREAGRQAVTDYVKGLDEANKMMEFELSVMGLSEQAREVAIEQYRIELELKKQIAAVNRNEGFTQADRDEEIARLTAAAARAKANASNKVFLDEWKNSVKQYDDIFRQGFADMLNRGEDGWKSFTRSLVTTFKTTVADAIYKMFLQPFVVQIVGQFVGMTGGGGMLGLLGGGSGGGAMDMLSMGKNIYSAISGGFTSLTNSIAMYVQRGFNYLTGAGPMTAGQLPGAAAQGIGLAGSYVAGAYGGVMAGRLISNGYSVFGSSGNTAVNAGTIIGSIFGGPMGGVIGGAIGGLVNRVFGRKLKDTGIEGTFGGDTGFEGRTYQYYKGGFLRSNKTKYGELDEEVRKGLADQFSAMKTSIKEMGKVLGLGGEALDKFTARIKVSLQGLSPEDAEKRLKEEFEKLGISMADLILGMPTTIQEAVSDRKYLFGVNPDAAAAAPVDPVAQANLEAFKKLQKAGESSLDTLTRLATSLAATNGVFETLGHSMYAASLQGGDMADKLVELFGGVEKFTAASADYFAKFYSAEEQREAARKQLEKQLATVDIKLPSIDATDARAQYRKLVEAQDLNTEAGRKAYAMLIQLAGAFDAVAVASLDAAAAAQEAARKQQEITDKGRDLEQRLLIAQGKDRQALDLRRLQEYYALLNLNPELARMVIEIYKAEDAAAALVAAQQGREDAYRRLQNAATLQSEKLNAQLATIDAQRTALGQQRTLADESLALLTGIFDLVRTNARELYGQVESTASMQAAQGWAFLERALATAKATGYLPEQAPLQEAIGAARSGLDSRAYASQFEADRDRLVLAGMLSGLEGIAGKQKTAVERQIEAIEAQGKALDVQTEAINKQLKAQQEMLDYWRRQIDIANGTFDATISVEQAIEKLRATLTKEPDKGPDGTLNVKPDRAPADATGPSGAVFGGSAYGAPRETAEVLPRDDYGRVLYRDGSKGPPVDSWFEGTILKWARLSPYNPANVGKHLPPLPAFAVGTNFVPRDMVAQIHEGEAIVPKAFNPWASGAAWSSGADNAALLAEVRALRQEVAALRAAGERTADNTAPLPGLADQFDQVTEGGNGMRADVMNRVEVEVMN